MNSSHIVGIHHFSLSVRDADRSLAFYRDLCGLTVVSDRYVDAGGYVGRLIGAPNADSVRLRIVHLTGYGVNLELLQYDEPRGSDRPPNVWDAGAAHVCFITDDLDTTLRYLVTAGFRPRSSPVTTDSGPNKGGRSVYLDDPDGIPVEIVQLARPWPGMANR